MVRSSAGGSRPITRSSIRQSLGRAFADVINKDGKDADKATKKIKDARRSSALNLKPTAPRDSMGEVRPQTQPVRKTGTPDSVTLTRKRLSINVQRPSLDEQSSKSNETTPREGPVTRSTALRPSSRQNAISALPKYQPKSAVSERTQQPPSPPHITTRRRLRTSEDEKEEKQNSKEPGTPQSSSQKGTRPISPLPLRALRNGSPSNSTPPSTPRHQPVIPPSAKSSPTTSSRPPKAVKTATSSVASQANATREYSSSSSSPGTPRTPKINITKATARRGDQENLRQKSSSVSSSPQRSSTESPVAHRQLRNVADLTYDSPMSHISEATSEEDDVALLLAPMADPTAPTPAMPRLGKARNRDKYLPRTPSRPGHTLPSRSQMSYLSPLPPTESSPSRPRPQAKGGDDRMLRASILSWEQVANEASKTLGEDEVHSMLADIPAPFTSAQISPSISFNGMDIPDSPCLSVLNSPGAFGSISQVLLPDMTPSPAVHNNGFKYAAKNDLGSADGATVTLLKLQLVAAENMAKERLSRLLMLEEEMHNLKEEHRNETSELSLQISRMQDQLCEKEEYEERIALESAAHTASLEEKIKNARILQEKAVQEGIARSKERERLARKAEYRQWHVAMSAACVANVAHTEWSSVRDLSEAELETVQGDRQILSVLLAELDRLALLVN